MWSGRVRRCLWEGDMAGKQKGKTKVQTIVTSGKTTRTGRTRDGGQYIIHIEIDGVEVNGETVPGQMVVDAIADNLEQAVAGKETK